MQNTHLTAPYESSSLATPALLGALWVLGSCGNGDYDSNGYNGVCRRQAAYKTHRRRRYHNPLNPLNPLNLLNLHTQRVCPCLLADRYLSPIVSNAACTEILRLRLRMTVPGGKSRNADFILIAKDDTITLSRKAAVKLQNLKNLRSQRLRQPSRQRRVKRRYHNPQRPKAAVKL